MPWDKIQLVLFDLRPPYFRGDFMFLTAHGHALARPRGRRARVPGAGLARFLARWRDASIYAELLEGFAELYHRDIIISNSKGVQRESYPAHPHTVRVHLVPLSCKVYT